MWVPAQVDIVTMSSVPSHMPGAAWVALVERRRREERVDAARRLADLDAVRSQVDREREPAPARCTAPAPRRAASG